MGLSSRSVLLLCLSALLATALAACPPNGQSTTKDGVLICVFCEDGSTAVMSYGGEDLSCSCDGNKECSVTVDGKAGTLQDFIDATRVSPSEADGLVSTISETVSEATEESSSSSSSESTSTTESSSSTVDTVSSATSNKVGAGLVGLGFSMYMALSLL